MKSGWRARASVARTCSVGPRLFVVSRGSYSNPAADYCLVYDYYGTGPTGCQLPAPGTNNNGNVMGYWYQDSVNSSFSYTASYTYDGVNRLATAVATPFGNGTASYNLTFETATPTYQGYDAYGNMTCVQNSNTHGYCPQWAYNTGTNQLTTSGFPYDASGNLTRDSSNASSHTWQWDGEGRVASVDSGSTWNFTYNALGDRAQWGTAQHLFDAAGTWLGVSGNYTLVTFGGRNLAIYQGGQTAFNHVNALGSTTMDTSQTGAVAEDVLFYPWGDLWQLQGSGGYNFAEMPYDDTTTNTDLTTFRVYSPNLGRWFSPGSVRGDVTNPQSLNLYPYVTDNPTTLTDPSGLCGCGGGDFGFGEGGGGWGGGCGGGFGGGFGGRRGGGPPPPPPIIPLPGPITTSIAGGGLFSDPFSFASVEGAPPPLVDIVYSLPLDPTPSDTGKCHGTVSNFAPAGAFDLCQDQGMYLMEAWSCDQGGSKLCCEAKQIQFEDCCSGYGWTPIPLNNGRSFLAECCSKTKRTLPPPGGKAPYCAGG